MSRDNNVISIITTNINHGGIVMAESFGTPQCLQHPATKGQAGRILV